jgi:hypothetical protein
MPNNVIIPDLVGGVSQLPQDQRDANQVTLLDNGFPSKSYGLRKRPPATQVGVMKADQVGWDDAFVHSVNRTPTERYTVVVANGDLKVFDTIAGTESTVFFPNGKAYLVNSVRGFRAFTVGDHTFIVNRDFVVKKGTARSASPVRDCLVFVRSTDFEIEYLVKIDNFYFKIKTGKTSISTDDVASSLLHAMKNAQYHTEFFQQFTVELFGSSLYIKRIDGKKFNITANDGLGDKGMKVINGKVQALEDLPERAKEGMVVEVTGDPGSTLDNMWVVYEAGSGDGVGVWRETTAPKARLDFNDATMPHELVRQGVFGPPITCWDLPRQPTFTRTGGSNTVYGFTTNGLDVALSGTAADAKVVSNYGGAVRTAGVTGHATLDREVAFGYDIDLGVMFGGTPANVVFSANTGAGWVVIGTVHHPAGTVQKNLTYSTVGVFPTGTRFEAKLLYPMIPGTIPLVGSRQAKLTMHGTTSDLIPGVVISEVPEIRFSLGDPLTRWPKGAVLNVSLDGTPFAYTLPDDQTSIEVAQAMAALINPHASFNAVYTGPDFYAGGGVSAVHPAGFDKYINGTWAGASGGQVYYVNTAGFNVTKSTSAAPTTVTTSFAFDTTRFMWNPGATMTPGEHAGRTLRNTTDGSEGLIVTNSRHSIEVVSLSGGVDNTFTIDDSCSIVDLGSAYYVFKEVEWADRKVGNDELNPFPSFCDKRISEVLFHANRLGFTAEDFVVMTASGDLKRFFKKTVTKLLDDDPIDVRNAHKDVGFLDSAIGWEGRLLLCSSSGHQFSLVGEPAITPATVRLEHMSSYPQTGKCRPLAAGNSVFFARTAAGFAQLRELYITRDGIDAAQSTEHVPRYIPGDVINMCGDADAGFLALLPSGGDHQSVYVYCYGALADQKRQKAWARWTFGGRVIGIDYCDGYLYLVRYRLGAVYLDRIAVANPPDPAATHQDVGVSYTFQARLSRVYVSDGNGNPLISGRTQLHTVRPALDGGDCRVDVTPANRTARSYLLGPRRLRAPVLAENKAVTIDLVNDITTGCTITGLEYEVSYTNRSK